MCQISLTNFTNKLELCLFDGNMWAAHLTLLLLLFIVVVITAWCHSFDWMQQ